MCQIQGMNWRSRLNTQTTHLVCCTKCQHQDPIPTSRPLPDQDKHRWSGVTPWWNTIKWNKISFRARIKWAASTIIFSQQTTQMQPLSSSSSSQNNNTEMPQVLSLFLPVAGDGGEILVDEETAEKERFIMFTRVLLKWVSCVLLCCIHVMFRLENEPWSIGRHTPNG